MRRKRSACTPLSSHSRLFHAQAYTDAEDAASRRKEKRERQRATRLSLPHLFSKRIRNTHQTLADKRAKDRKSRRASDRNSRNSDSKERREEMHHLNVSSGLRWCQKAQDAGHAFRRRSAACLHTAFESLLPSLSLKDNWRTCKRLPIPHPYLRLSCSLAHVRRPDPHSCTSGQTQPDRLLRPVFSFLSGAEDACKERKREDGHELVIGSLQEKKVPASRSTTRRPDAILSLTQSVHTRQKAVGEHGAEGRQKELMQM